MAREGQVATKSTKAKTKCKMSLLKMCKVFLNKIKNTDGNKNEQVFKDCFFYQTLSYLAKCLYDSDQIKNNEIKNGDILIMD